MSTEAERKIMSNNIKRYLDMKGVTRLQICDDLDIKYTTLADWINAKTYPRMGKIEMMANYFGCEKSDLIEERFVSSQTKAHKIPVYGKVAAGFPIEMVEEVLDYEEIPAKWGDPSDFFCLQIKGDSMKPKIEEGDVVVVHKQADADTGSVVIASINGEEATCKKLRKTDNGIFLMPTNNDYEPIFFTNEDIEALPVKILGKVVELRAKF